MRNVILKYKIDSLLLPEVPHDNMGSVYHHIHDGDVVIPVEVNAKFVDHRILPDAFMDVSYRWYAQAPSKRHPTWATMIILDSDPIVADKTHRDWELHFSMEAAFKHDSLTDFGKMIDEYYFNS